MSPDHDAWMARMDVQNAEFDAVHNLSRAYIAITATPIVDDDYPAVRHVYERELRNLLAACKANGRIVT